LAEQIRLQREAMEHLCLFCRKNGALGIEAIEVSPVMSEGKVIDLAVTQPNVAREIIQNFMVAANIQMARFLEERQTPVILRVVREPRRWDRIVEVAAEYDEHLPEQPDVRALSAFLDRRKAADPIHFPDLSLTVVKLLGPGDYVVQAPGEDAGGHFGLAAHEYTHSTAPNRRYVDLVIQRLVKALLAGQQPPYTLDELKEIAARCNERESAANKVERKMRKAIAATWMGNRIGETFQGIVTGASPKGTWVRLITPPVEGKIVRGEEGLDVGDQVQVRLIHTNVERGFIDFERVGAARRPGRAT
jgi:exoribonuclease-2